VVGSAGGCADDGGADDGGGPNGGASASEVGSGAACSPAAYGDG
jgi:hypothetical protein